MTVRFKRYGPFRIALRLFRGPNLYWIAHFHPPDRSGGRRKLQAKVYIIRGAGHLGGQPAAAGVPTRLDHHHHHHPPGQPVSRPGRARARVRACGAGAPDSACLPACAEDWAPPPLAASRPHAPLPARARPSALSLPRSPSPAARRPAPPLSSPLPAGSSRATLPLPPLVRSRLPRDAGGSPAPPLC